MSLKRSEQWNKFYAMERQLFDFVADNGQLVRTIDDKPAEYVISHRYQSLIYVPPESIRQVYRLDANKLSEAKDKANAMILEYTKAMAEDNKVSKRLPARFPQIFSGVTKINIQTNEAYSSFLVRTYGDPLPIARYFTNKTQEDTINKAVCKLRALGINAIVLDSTVTGEQAKYIFVQPNELLKYFGLQDEELRCRRSSGTQYRAFVYQGKEKVRTNIGYLLCEGDFDVYDTLPQEPRSHKTELCKTQLTFDGGLIGQHVEFYRAEIETVDED
ncbi:MAG: hypothetical protein LRY75_05280 [Shewanella xiamenensis]|nr:MULTISPECIES: hypothetical protein [Shewanella]MCD8558236.1 hypothetical protein [Shewanella xiamenensis]MCK7657683.1 hypothetical protein [Shewanella sp. JNE4-2]MCT8858106.1 hypothetical protein [Shewanella xiamenensis]MDH0451003.1 hypothetical protein [Shewanella sp. GD04112]MDV5393145.1 hypothetical protein [Shewanella xiamenensis]